MIEGTSMQSYAEISLFKGEDLGDFSAATKLVALIPSDPRVVPYLRCHEVARVVGLILSLECQDGYYGPGAEHSWLWTAHGQILDVYCIGRLPAVQLIGRTYPMAEQGRLYNGGPTRTDIREHVVNALYDLMQHLTTDVEPLVTAINTSRGTQ